MRRKFTILLSASVPSKERSDQFKKIPNAQIQIEQAVIGLARNVFQAGGRLIFGGHPSISPLVAMIATEYELDRDAESSASLEPQNKPVNIYQSRAYEEVMPKETSTLFNLGYARIIWTEAVNGEKCNMEIKEVPQCEKSLKVMRELMISQDIDALVCIGGMKGVVNEFNLFREKHPSKPIYLFETTGGASGSLSHEYSNLSNVRVIDETINDLQKSDREIDNEREKIEIIPYTFFAAKIVEELLNLNNERRGLNF